MTHQVEISDDRSWMQPEGLPMIIAGPCSAETEEQVLDTARQIASDSRRINVFRAGIWKPRTRPNNFEGVGEAGLKWLQKVQSETGLQVAVEVANAQHVELALSHGIDILWIGARTSVNPFSVQEIAEALKGCDIPVLVKNPINPDLPLWIGAIERLNQVGITKLAAIHRGFSTFDQSAYRNIPKWEIAIELKRLMPGLPVLCDPSHIAGRRDLLLPVAQKALDLNMSGLMIETHKSPDQAWSDPNQQITPKRLFELLDELIIRQGIQQDIGSNRLEALRKEIDIADRHLLDALAERMKLIREVGKYKKVHDILILQMERWNEIINDRPKRGKMMDLDEDFVRALYELIHQYSIHIQTEIMNSPEPAIKTDQG